MEKKLFIAYASMIYTNYSTITDCILVLYGSFQMGDRVGPVGTGEAGHTAVASGPGSRCPVNWSMSLDRQEALVSICPFPFAVAKILDDTLNTFLHNRMQWITQPKFT